MTVSSELKGTEETPKYPYLAKSKKNGFVVLFTESCTGVVVNKACVGTSIGHHSDAWMEENFVPLPKGSTITLTQE